MMRTATGFSPRDFQARAKLMPMASGIKTSLDPGRKKARLAHFYGMLLTTDYEK